MVETANLVNDSVSEELSKLLAVNHEALKEALLARLKQLEEAVHAVDAEIAGIQEEMSRRVDEAKKRRQPIEDALTHLNAFLIAEGWLRSNQEGMKITYGADGNSKPSIEGAYEFLATFGRPVHYRELAQRLSENGIYLAGKNPAATLLSQMARDGRFKRTGRGIYGLSSWKQRPSIQRRRKSRKRGAKRHHKLGS